MNAVVCLFQSGDKTTNKTTLKIISTGSCLHLHTTAHCCGITWAICFTTLWKIYMQKESEWAGMSVAACYFGVFYYLNRITSCSEKKHNCAPRWCTSTLMDWLVMDLNPKPFTGSSWWFISHTLLRSGWRFLCSLWDEESEPEYQILLQETDKDFSWAESNKCGGTQEEMSDDNQELPPSLLSKHTHRKHTQERAHTHRSTNR